MIRTTRDNSAAVVRIASAERELSCVYSGSGATRNQCERSLNLNAVFPKIQCAYRVLL